MTVMTLSGVHWDLTMRNYTTLSFLHLVNWSVCDFTVGWTRLLVWYHWEVREANKIWGRLRAGSLCPSSVSRSNLVVHRPSENLRIIHLIGIILSTSFNLSLVNVHRARCEMNKIYWQCHSLLGPHMPLYGNNLVSWCSSTSEHVTLCSPHLLNCCQS